MEFPERGMALIDALYQQNTALATGTLDQQRLLTKLIAEQFAFTIDRRWGMKSASPERPVGPSTIAFNGPPLTIFRWSDGDGHVTGIPGSPLHPPLMEPLDQSAGQTFVSVNAVDHLHTADKPKPVPSPPPAPDLTALVTHLERRIELLEAELRPIQAAWASVIDDLHRFEHRRYKGSLGPFTIISTPE